MERIDTKQPHACIIEVLVTELLFKNSERVIDRYGLGSETVGISIPHLVYIPIRKVKRPTSGGLWLVYILLQAAENVSSEIRSMYMLDELLTGALSVFLINASMELTLLREACSVGSANS